MATSRERRAATSEYAIVEGYPGAHDPAYLTGRPKVLGSFIVEADRIPFDMPNLDLGAGSPYLRMHVPPIKYLLGREDLRDSHKLTAEYVALNGLAHTEVTGVGGLTSMKFARAARRMLGFEIADIDPGQLPAEQVAHAQHVYDCFVGGNEPFKPAFVHQSLDALVGRYASEDAELARLSANPPLPQISELPAFDYYA